MISTFPECHDPPHRELTTDQAARLIVQACSRCWMMILKRKSKSMMQAKEILISGGKLTRVEGDYHEHNTIYVVKESPFPRPNYFPEVSIIL